MPNSQRRLQRRRRLKTHHTPFWQADKPYLHEHQITDARFRWFGYVMAALAGAINAGGFFAVARYTSHVTGELSHAADMAYTGEWGVVAVAMFGVLCFVLGAAHSSWIILWTKRQRFRGSFGLSMWLEAVYLLFFGVLGVATLSFGETVVPPVAIFLLCFIMGMHNTVMTIISGGAIRSTHMTGTATDLGIELSKLLYYQRSDNPRLPHVYVNQPKIRLFVGLMVAFLLGGLVGAWGYHTVGHHFALPVALALFVLGFGSVGYDVKIRLKLMLIRRLRERGLIQ
ncbi:MAG: YoaK family protein [Neisseria sp.]|nr:YoaK family protein [Neisseria sp.]